TFEWVVDNAPPTITAAASLPVLWPANGKSVSDTISGTVTDALSGVDPGTVTFQGVDEYGEIQPAGPISLGSGGQFSFVLPLEARRLGQDSDGRRYQIIVKASDKAGNQASASAVVV